jgi:hypothetical protein
VSAFSICPSLPRIQDGVAVLEIQALAFTGCTSLTEVEFNANFFWSLEWNPLGKMERGKTKFRLRFSEKRILGKTSKL